MEFKKYNETIVVNGHKVEVELTVTVKEDEPDLLLDCDFENEEEKTELIRKIQSGSVFSGVINVSAKAEGLEGWDSLGGCYLISNSLWNSHPFEASVNSYLKDHEMEANALDHLKAELEAKYSRLIEKAKQYKKYSKEGI